MSNVAVVHHLATPRGSTRLCQRLVEGLAERRIESRFFCLAEPLQPPDFYARRSYVGTAVDTGDYRANVELLARRLGTGLSSSRRVQRADVIHIHDVIDHLAIEQMRHRISGIPILRTVHHVIGGDGWLRDLERRSLEDVDALVTVSSYTTARLRDEYSLVPKRMIYNGVDHRVVPRSSEADASTLRTRLGLRTRFVFMALGGISPRKGTIELLRAISLLRRKLPERHFTLLVAGGGSPNPYQEYRRAVERFVEDSALVHGRDYSFLGILPERQLTELFAEADVFIAPSLLEGWGIGGLEAMSAGLPTMLSDLEVFREFAPHDDDALYVSAGDWRALADAMFQVMVDPDLRSRLAARGRRIASRYSWDVCVDEHLELYTQLTTGYTGVSS